MKQLIYLITGCIILWSVSATARTTDLFARQAQGELTHCGGARRLNAEQTDSLKLLLQNTKAKNVILFIGDGMGDSEITAARNYHEGAGGYFEGIDALPFSGQYTHYSLHKATHKPDYVTDSAASATAWATGTKTYNGALAVDVWDKPLHTILEIVKAAGKATGNVTTSEIQDATPAALYAHVIKRGCYGPEATTVHCNKNALEKGGFGSITEQLLEVRADVTLGGGSATFAEKAKAGKWMGKTLYQQALDRGYRIIHNLADLNAITVANQEKPILGLFASGNLPVHWMGPRASYHGNVDDAPVACQPNKARTGTIPNLAQMTKKAIDLLKNHPNGFFLQVEGASIDKAAHGANPCEQFGETVDLDEAVKIALDFARKHNDTLVILTADHAHSAQIIEPDAKAPGLTQALRTKDGSVMAISYGNSESPSQGHTGTQLRVAAFGPYAANVVGLTDQTDLFFTMLDAMGIRYAF